MLYEIINPSDAYTFEADDREVACVAMILLSEGRYGIHEINSAGQRAEFQMPPFLFASNDAIEGWFKGQFGRGLMESVEQVRTIKLDALATCFESAVLGSATDRLLFKSALEKIDDPVKKRAFLEEWDDKKRSSMNNIGAACQSVAKQLRAKLQESAEE